MDTSVKKRERERERERKSFPFTRFSPHQQSAVAGRPYAWGGNNSLLVAQPAICHLRGGNLHTNVVLRIISLRWQYAHCWSIGPVCSKITRLLHSAVANRARYLQRYFDRRCTIRRRCRTKGKEKYHTDRYFYVLQKKSQ